MRESSWKWAFDAHPGFSVSSGLLFPKLPFVSWLQIWRFETEGRVWPWARSTPFCARPNPPFSIQVSPLFFFFYILPAWSLYKRWWFSLFTHSCPPILCTRSSGDFASSFHEWTGLQAYLGLLSFHLSYSSLRLGSNPSDITTSKDSVTRGAALWDDLCLHLISPWTIESRKLRRPPPRTKISTPGRSDLEFLKAWTPPPLREYSTLSLSLS